MKGVVEFEFRDIFWTISNGNIKNIIFLGFIFDFQFTFMLTKIFAFLGQAIFASLRTLFQINIMLELSKIVCGKIGMTYKNKAYFG